MSLAEDAISAYEKDQLANKESEEKERKEFIENGIQTIKDRFGENLKIDIETDKDGDVIFIVDGLRMKVRRHQGYYNIYVVQTCPMCHEDYSDNVISLKDIGKLLKQGHSSYDCEKALKAKSPVKELTTEEKFLDALKALIYENSPEP